MIQQARSCAHEPKAAGRDVLLEERPILKRLQEAFEADGFRLPDLARAIATDPGFRRVANPRPETRGVAKVAGASEPGGKS